MPQGKKPVVLYDGDCVYCRAKVNAWKKKAMSLLSFQPCKDVVDQYPSVTPGDCLKSVQLIMLDGETFRGAEAVFRIRAYGGKRFGLWAYRAIPGFAYVSEFIYGFVASHRNKLVFPKVSKHFKQLAAVFLVVAVVLINLIIITNAKILAYRGFIEPSVENARPAPVALVFGGGMEDDGKRQTAMQEDRVRRGVELYERGLVDFLMMTGDGGTMRFNEVDAMKALAVELGVPEQDVLIDPNSFRTYESCYRAIQIYDIQAAIVVSQQFHLPRILYICRTMGIDARGVAANLRDYDQVYVTTIRETLARVKGWWQVAISKPEPHVLGIPMPIGD